VFVNGTATPDTLQLVAGTTYRLRTLYITTNDVIRTSLRGPAGLEPARMVGFDGNELPRVALPPGVPPRPLQANNGPGHTVDYAFTPGAPGDYALVFDRLAKGTGPGVTVGTPTIVPIRVRAP
jgi:hypothetical protein